MAKKNKKLSRTHHLEFWFLAAAAVLALAVMALLMLKPGNTENPMYISLGPMAYKIENNKAVKRTDKTVTNLREFLQANGDANLQQGCEAVYYSVVIANDDETQALVDYGCDRPGAKIFAVRSGESWRFISPTNKFDLFNIPECSYVAENAISKEIAPVCASGDWQTGNPQYQVR